MRKLRDFRSSVFVMVCSLGFLIQGLATIQAQVESDLSTTSGYGIAELRRVFEKASVPQAASLRGTWVMIRHISTEKFIRGRTGPDHILFNIRGIRSGGEPTGSLEWTLTLRGTPVTAGERDISSVSFNSAGELAFAKDYAGDSLWLYRCRSVNAQRLICLMKGAEDGHGVEFLKTND